MNDARRIFVFAVSSMLLAAGCASDKRQRAAENEAKSAKKQAQHERERRMSAEEERARTEAESAAEREQMREQVERLQAEMEAARQLADTRKEIYDDLKRDLRDEISAGDLELTTRRGLLVVRIPRAVLFESGRFGLSEEGERTLRTVASSFGDLEDRRILVAGHTDDVPVSNKAVKFEDNWELSTKRALVATRILAESGIEQNKLGVSGFAEHDPIASNDSAEGRSENRRVELMVLPNMAKVLESVRTAQAGEAN